MNLNKVIIVGNITRDPETKALPSGSNVCNFSIATNRSWTKDGEKQEQTEFHNVSAFGKLADIASQYLKKGASVLVEGRLQTRSWDDADGKKNYRTDIVAEGIQLGKKEE